MGSTGNPETWAVGERDTVIEALDRAVARHPDKILLDFSGELYTYSEVDLLSTKMANSLATLGVKAGETVLTMLDNNIDAVTTWLAINKLCAVSVPINTALKGEFLRHQIADTGTSLVICEAAYLARVTPLAEQLPEVRHILHRGTLDTVAECRIRIAPWISSAAMTPRPWPPSHSHPTSPA